MKNVYFIGIGGIGMSALARYYKLKGFQVAGYDRTPTDLTFALEREGIDVHYMDRPDLLPLDKNETLVVYTTAVPSDLKELVKAREEGYLLLKRSRTLGEIARGKRCLAVAGTHGKTTTSTLIAHILTHSKAGCNAFLGGISRNYDTNLLMCEEPVIVAEADEYDRSFLALHPEIAVITSVDPDHLDIYGDYAHVVEAFKTFASQVSGTLIAKKGTPIGPEDTRAKLLTYHYTDPTADFYPIGASADECGHFHFDLHTPSGIVKDFRVGIPGWVNCENSVAAAAVALCYGIPADAVREAIASFEGVKRRLEVHVNTPRLSYIDDYAHHPAELNSAISSMRDIFPGRKLTAIFQPHLYSRTRDFAPAFAEALSKVDKLILLDIYPAREEPIPGVSSEMIFKDVTLPEKVLLKKEELMDYLSEEPLDVLATFGAGNIDRFIEPITELVNTRLGSQAATKLYNL